MLIIEGMWQTANTQHPQQLHWVNVKIPAAAAQALDMFLSIDRIDCCIPVHIPVMPRK